MTGRLDIVSEWESLSRGTPEEQACFAAVGIQYNNIWLTEAHDDFVGRVREKVHLSAYRLAEWFAWNWWRLRWEPRTKAADWAMAHRMTTVGGGYVWPNITVFSDGYRAVLLAEPTSLRPEEPIRYITDFAAVVRASELEDAIDVFVDRVLERLRIAGICDTNLHSIWSAVRAERANPAVAKRRKIEALLGFDPDEAEESVIDALLRDAVVLGEGAMNEVAANMAQAGNAVTAQQLREIADANGFPARPGDAAHLSQNTEISPIGQIPAWKRGAEAAKALRYQVSLGAAPISNAKLAEMAGVSVETLTSTDRAGADFPFALDRDTSNGQVVLRSKKVQGRRFELARLIGDRIGGEDGSGLLFPATKSKTYRQKHQRAFAAELLCPFDPLEDMLRGDSSTEAIEEAAEYYDVSSYTTLTLLVNHGKMGRDSIMADF